MRILLITDQNQGSDHSAVEGIFGRHLKKYCEVDIVYFSKEIRSPQVYGSNLILPGRMKKRGTFEGLRTITDPAQYDIIIVRNLFRALRSVLKNQHRFHYRVGFWESFPHSFRRLHEARTTGRARLRKSLEYTIRQHLENALLARCDFYLPITETFKQHFRANLKIPYHPLPMGVDFNSAPPEPPPLTQSGPKRFIYIGTIDNLRDTALIFSTFAACKGDFVLDVFTQSNNSAVHEISALGDSRIHVYPPQPRAQLIQTMRHYDVGIGLIPPTELYLASSPTKTLEYYAAFIPAIINRLPEYQALFDENSAFICDMTEEQISSMLSRTLATSRDELRQIAKRGRDVIRRQRDYAVLASELYNFLTIR